MGDIHTLRTVLTAQESFLHRTLRRLGVGESDLDDVLQEVCGAVAKGLATFEPASAGTTGVRAWLVEICRRQAAGFRRQMAKRAEQATAPEELEELLEDGRHAEGAMLARERGVLLLELLAAVPVAERVVVVAYELEGVAMRDVAAGLGIPEGTAWARLRRGKLALEKAAHRRAMIGDRCAAPSPVLVPPPPPLPSRPARPPRGKRSGQASPRRSPPRRPTRLTPS